MRIYFVRPGLRVRLGTLGTLERRTFVLRSEVLGARGQFQLEADPLGSTEQFRSEWILANRGDRVEWTVAHRLGLSNVVVKR